MSASITDAPAWSSIAAVTKRFGLSQSRVYEWLNAGLIRGKKVGVRRTLIDNHSVAACIDNLPDFKAP